LRALILAAGLGTRLRPLTSVRAKAAVPVNGIPLISRVVSWLVSEGIPDMVINLHHQPASIARLVGDGAGLGARVRYSWEHPVLGSAGGPRRALPLLVERPGLADGDTFLMVNGDTLTRLSLRTLADVHRESRALVTMALIPNPRPDVYGGVVIADGWVRGFTRPGAGEKSYHFIGVQAARAGAFAALEDGIPAESVMGLYPRLMAEDPRAIRGHVVEAPFDDIGTPADYLQTSVALVASEGDQLISRRDVTVHPSASLRLTAVWDGVTVADGCVLEESIVCDGVSLPAGSRYRRTAIVPFRGQPVRADERVESGLLLRSF
jgi:mannose-1-phosphate guanylyltransferase